MPLMRSRTKEEKEEERRIRDRKKQLVRRTTKDQSARPDWARKPVKLPDPIQQPDPTIEEESEVEPPREGLIPGTWAVQKRVGTLLDRPRLPSVWSAAHVGVRLIEAHRVLQRMPGTIWPKQFGAAWPAYQPDYSDLVVQAGAYTLAIGRNNTKISPSAEAVARMMQAIAWPLQYLSNRPGACADVNLWACNAAFDQMDFDSREAPWESLQIIAQCLNAANEAVT